MPGRVRFVCLLHSHQPVGNFDSVIEEAYQKSYLPYVQVFEDFPAIPLTNHFSGCLLEWIEGHHPEYFERLRRNVAGSGRKDAKPWEMVGGGFHEPIMTMLPARDRDGQIRRLADYLEKHFGRRPRGLWLTERVWEPALVYDLAAAGVEYLTLDDNHFKAAGLGDQDLVGAFVTEDQGRTLRVYPASERLRYLIPYAKVEEVVQHLRALLPADGERVVCYADDGEKFGVWPRTYKHVYEDGWLRKLLGALQAAQDEGWLVCTTLAEAADEVLPVGRVYLPENSYREMTEWALPAGTLAAYERAVHAVKDDPRVRDILPLVKGGNWRSFRVKYPEGGRMYGKMMEVSRKAAALPADSKLAEKARTHLYRGQCNCPYWHGVFGGMYLPHLRSAVYGELIRAEKLINEVAGGVDEQAEDDYDFDGEPEVKLANARMALYFHPARGGHLYEFDLRHADFNAGDTFSRRYEAYHEKVARAVVGATEGAQSIHDLVLAKQAGLEKLLQYDAYLRESLVDHLSRERLKPEHFLSGRPPSNEGFRQGRYVAHLEPPLARKGRKKPAQDAEREKRLELLPPGGAQFVRRAAWDGREVEVRKLVFFNAPNSFEVRYVVENRHPEVLEGFFTVEMNYSLLAGDAHDRYYYHGGAENAGRLACVADWGKQPFVGLKDHWLNVALTLRPSEPAQVLVSPVQTVSQSEGGFESVYQSSCVALQWPLKVGPWQSFAVRLAQETGTAH